MSTYYSLVELLDIENFTYYAWNTLKFFNLERPIFSYEYSLFEIDNNNTYIAAFIESGGFRLTKIETDNGDKWENKEFSNMKKKMEEIMGENKELKKKLEEFILKENKYNYQNNLIENLKCQVETLNNSIKFKESKINSLQNIIDKNKSNQNLFNSNSISEQDKKNITDKNKSILQITNNKNNLLLNNNNYNNDFQLGKGFKNINRYDNNIISKITISSYNENLNSNNNNSNIYTSKNSIEETNKNDIINNIDYENVNIKTPSDKKIKKNENVYYGEENLDSVLKNKREKNVLNDEIEQLDQEILNLKSKLTQIIKK